jgi:hypothetical protein
MRARVLVGVVAVVAVAAIGGASQRAEAASTGPARTQHCTIPFVGTFPAQLITSVASGSGAVTPPSGFYPCNSVVNVSADPAENFKFVGWDGTCSGQGTPCSLFLAHMYMETVYTAGARFERIKQTVTVQKSGEGNVKSDPVGVDCGPTCAAEFGQGEQVAFDATPAGNAPFNGWGGACQTAQKNKRCVIVVPPGGTTVTASFGPPPVPLTVGKVGNGTVSSSPAGISCGAACSVSFAHGTRVTLTATPDPDHPFQGWGGACSGSGTTCSLTLTAATSVQARFAQGKVDGLAAVFQGTWKRSVYSGSLAITGIATRDAYVTATISSAATPGARVPQAGSVQQSFQFAVGQGAFNRAFPLPKTGFFPGAYTVQLTGTIGGAPILARTTTVRMEAPKEGVVHRAWVTAGKGKAVTRAPRGTKRLVAHFVYAAKPFIGSKVTVSWFLGRRPLGTVRKIRWKPIVVTDVASPAALPPGRYTCVLRARGLVVYEVSVRVG